MVITDIKINNLFYFLSTKIRMLIIVHGIKEKHLYANMLFLGLSKRIVKEI